MKQDYGFFMIIDGNIIREEELASPSGDEIRRKLLPRLDSPEGRNKSLHKEEKVKPKTNKNCFNEASKTKNQNARKNETPKPKVRLSKNKEEGSSPQWKLSESPNTHIKGKFADYEKQHHGGIPKGKNTLKPYQQNRLKDKLMKEDYKGENFTLKVKQVKDNKEQKVTPKKELTKTSTGIQDTRNITDSAHRKSNGDNHKVDEKYYDNKIDVSNNLNKPTEEVKKGDEEQKEVNKLLEEGLIKIEDKEKPPERLKEGVKIGTEEERLKVIEYFLQLGYETPFILKCEKLCGSDKDRIINYIDTIFTHQ